MTLRTLADKKNKLENIERMGSVKFSLVKCIHCINNRGTVSEKMTNLLYYIKVITMHRVRIAITSERLASTFNNSYNTVLVCI